MPAFIRKLTASGLEPVDYTADSLTEAAHHEPATGIYTVTNTYNVFHTLKLNAHLDRMEDSAQRAGITLNLDRERLRMKLRHMIAESNYGDVRFRVTVPAETPEVFIITLEPYTPPAQSLIENGVRVITAPNSARHNAAAKTTDWMHLRKRISDTMPDGIYDAILLDEKEQLLEGLGANFYAIKDDTLRTAAEGVLPGIAQQIVFEVAPQILPVQKTPVIRSEITELQEAFITSSSRGIIPVVEIDGHKLGNGQPGTKTKVLRERYIAWVNDHLEPL